MNYLNLSFSAKEEIISFPFQEETLLVPAPYNLANLNSIIAVNESGYQFWLELMSGLTPNQICEKWSKQSGLELEILQSIALNMLCILKPILEENKHGK